MAKKEKEIKEDKTKKKAAEDTAEKVAEENKTEGAVAENSPGDDEDLQAKYVRLAADFQNFKRRTENEKSEIYAFANENIVKDLLNVRDNFERAIDQAKDSTDKKFADGVALIYKQFNDVLEKFGTKEIEALGVEFNPNLHNAVMMDNSGNGESGKVTEVLQKGYTLNNRVVRPAMVKVAE